MTTKMIRPAVQAHTNGVSKPESPPPPIFAPRTLADLLVMPSKAWIIDEIIGAGDLATIYGAPGTGKTFVVIDLIFAACLGGQFAMRFSIDRPLNVAYCAGEGVSGLPSRFAAAAAARNVSGLPTFTFFDIVPQLHIDRDPLSAEIASIHNFVNEWKSRQEAGEAKQLDLLVLDTLHAATEGADENSAKDMGRVLHLLKSASKELGCAIILVHHTNKAGTGERGSSSLRGAMDCMIEVKSCGNKYLMCCEKLKDGERWKSQTFDLVSKLDSVRVWWDEPADNDGKASKTDADIKAIVALLKNSQGARYTANAIAEAIGIGGSKAIFKLLPTAMADEESGIMCGLKNPEKDSSPHNPMVYWYSTETLVTNC